MEYVLMYTLWRLSLPAPFAKLGPLAGTDRAGVEPNDFPASALAEPVAPSVHGFSRFSTVFDPFIHRFLWFFTVFTAF
jgi:hypothetical protein